MTKFHKLEVVGRGSETQLQVCENLNYLINHFKVNISSLYTVAGAGISKELSWLMYKWHKMKFIIHSSNKLQI